MIIAFGSGWQTSNIVSWDVNVTFIHISSSIDWFCQTITVTRLCSLLATGSKWQAFSACHSIKFLFIFLCLPFAAAVVENAIVLSPLNGVRINCFVSGL